MEKQQFFELLDKYLEGAASDEETRMLLHYYNSFQQPGEWNEAELGNSNELELKILQQLDTSIKKRESTSIVPFYKHAWFRLTAAATTIFILGSVLWWGLNKNTEQPMASIAKTDLFPVKNKILKTTLMLADGRLITIDSIANGLVAKQGSTEIKMLNGKLVYEVPKKKSAGKPALQAYNIVSTPRGKQYQVEIPDGSKVWLNAASSIRFPTAFTGKERKVELTGEAYFEVAKDAAKPFRILTAPLSNGSPKRALIEVLGTHFNISAYDDEKEVTTTLLEGSVKVTSVNNARPTRRNTHVLKPGQQAQISAVSLQQEDMLVKAVDVEEVMAWRNNLFNFNTANIETIMRQIARWYDVEVIYEGKMPLRNFSGKISRDTDLANVLKILEQSNIHFRIQGKKIIVMS